MSTKHTQRKRIFKSGLAMLLLGAVLGITGFASAPASAAGNDHQITICHATGSGSNPYTTPNPNKWQITAPNGHGFDTNDIIPPFPAGEKGSHSWLAYAGLNWTGAGQATYDQGCVVTPAPSGSITLDKVTAGDGQPADTTSFGFTVSCETDAVDAVVNNAAPTIAPADPATTVAGGLASGDTCTITEIATAGAASTSHAVDGASDVAGTSVVVTIGGTASDVVFTNTYECPTGQTPDDDGGCASNACVPSVANNQCVPCPTGNPDGLGKCATVIITDACPTVDGAQADTTLCATTVIDNVIEVEGVQIVAAPAAPELPRTGSTTLPLAELGLGLVLMGAGALVFGREQTATV